MSLNSLQDDMSRRAASMAAMAKRARNPQEIQAIQKSLIDGVQSGAIQPYIGIPLIQDLTKKMTEAKAQMAQSIAGAGMQQPQGQQGAPIAQQVMQQAAQESQGVEALPSNLPQEYAGGGIIAFEDGGSSNKYETPFDRMTRLTREREKAEAEAQARLTPEQRIRQDRASMMQPLAAAGDIVGGPYNYLMQTGESIANAIGVPRIGKALGIYDKDVTSVGIPRIGQGGDTPFMDMTRRYAAGETAPAPGAGINKDLGPVPGTTDKDVLGGRPTGGITTLPAAGRPPAAPTAAGPAPGPAQTPFVMPPPPTGKSAEDFARSQFTGLGERSDARLATLTAAQDANKMEGKAFDGLKKTLEDEAAQAGIEKSDAKNMAIFKAGLAMMSGTSRNALENIGKGAMVGAENYQKAAADLKKADKERQKQFAAIEEARRAEDRDDIKTRNARLETAYKAGQRMDELGSAAISAGFGVDNTQGMDIWKTQFSGAATQRAAETSAAASKYSADTSAASARYSADVGASSRVQAAELKAVMAGLGGGKGALTQDQLIKNRQALADSPQIAAYKDQLVKQFGKNVVNQPGYQDAINKQIDQLLMQMSAQPGASMGLNITPAQQSLISKYLNPR
jgi:hypothetical protein